MNVVIIGAHPDDPEAIFGGAALRYRELGHRVTLISMTNGDAGHHRMSRETLAARRRAEADNVARLLAAEYVILPIHDGELTPSLENRERLIRVLREKRPDLVVTHPPIDYHPDHRYTSQLVMDTSYLLVVPNIVPDVPAIRKNPAYFFATAKPVGDAENVCVPIDAVWERKVSLWHQHASQMYEWLPWVDGRLDEVPETETDRLAYLSALRERRHVQTADAFRDELLKKLGASGAEVRRAEAVYAAPIGKRLAPDEWDLYFPFFAKTGE